MAYVVSVGEGMFELSRTGKNWSVGYGGDSLNTAIHLARLGNRVSYLTALGSSAFSHTLKEQWIAEGLDHSLILSHPTREVGMYAINTDSQGERTFSYWRDQSAAREMFALPAMLQALNQAAQADLLYFSLITLAILPPAHRELLFKLAQQVKSNGGKVAFDSNYRPKLWGSVDEARSTCAAAIKCADIGLPTQDDERLLWDAASHIEVAARWTDLGCKEIIVKLGGEGCRLQDGTIVSPTERLVPIDTSGAGDAFNAGYLDARLKNADPTQSAQAGHALAGWTIMRAGAIPPLSS